MGILESRLLRQGLFRSLVAANTLKPMEGSTALTVPSFFGSWIAGEAAPAVLGIWGARTARELARANRRDGGLKLADYVGLGLTVGAATALVAAVRTAGRSEEQLHAAVSRVVPEEDLDNRRGTKPASDYLPFITEASNRVRTRNVEFANVDGKSLKLDVYEPKTGALSDTPRPAIIQIHGGAWIIGAKEEQGIPLLNHLAGAGWVGFNVNYRLSPKVKSPVHLQDCKRALVWVRENAERYNIDPNFVVVTGGSAGGHLTALMALTANDPDFQPGFEDADTSVQAAVPFYGVYDMLAREGDQAPEFVELMDRLVMDGDPVDDKDDWSAYSPIDQIHEGAPPMMVIHGSNDVLVPVRGARRFVGKLSEYSENPVVYAELEGAQHAFDIFPSIRTNNTVQYVERFLHEMHNRYLSNEAVDLVEPTNA